jgi:hypothetical protein
MKMARFSAASFIMRLKDGGGCFFISERPRSNENEVRDSGGTND